MWSKHCLDGEIGIVKLILFGYFIILFVSSFLIFPSHDILFYYYPWSTNLQLSYYDGPPLIAYIIRLSTMIFGGNVFALNVWGVLVALLTCYIIIGIATLLKNRDMGYWLALFWICYPFSTTRFIFITLNYDCLENCLALMTLFFTLRFMITQRSFYLYVIGISGGILLLAKYSGIILLLAILLYLIINKESRKVFSSIHIYLAIVLCLIIFSPVLVWNYQHDWISFYYQLTTHSWSQGTYNAAKKGFSGVMFYIFTDVLGVTHILWVIIFGIYYTNKIIIKQQSYDAYTLLWFIATVYFIFWLFASYSSHVAMNYLIVFNSLILIICGSYLYLSDKKKMYFIIVSLFIFISSVMLIKRAFVKETSIEDAIQFKRLQLSVNQPRKAPLQREC